MKKFFLVEMNYKEKTESLFTEMGVEVTFDNQLHELKQNGNISSYEDTKATELHDGDALNERIEELEKAIEWYADKLNYEQSETEYFEGYPPEVLNERGYLARKVLNK